MGVVFGSVDVQMVSFIVVEIVVDQVLQFHGIWRWNEAPIVCLLVRPLKSGRNRIEARDLIQRCYRVLKFLVAGCGGWGIARELPEGELRLGDES